MFKIKKAKTVGVCVAMRCSSPAQDLLCPRHLKEWQDAGSPALETNTPTAPKEAGGLLPVEVQNELTEERHKAQKALQMIQSIPVETEAQRAFASQLINIAGAKIKELETKRKEATGPLTQAKKTIDSWFSPAVEFYEQSQKLLKDKLKVKLLELEAAQDAALALVQDNPREAAPEVFAVAHATPEAPAGISAKRNYKYRVTNFELVPDKYKIIVLDHAELTRQVHDLGPEAVIPGIEVYADMDIRRTAR